MSKKIIFKINKEGNVLIDKVEGYGANCKDFTRLLEESLGSVDEASREYTGEYTSCTSSTTDLLEKTEL